MSTDLWGMLIAPVYLLGAVGELAPVLFVEGPLPAGENAKEGGVMESINGLSVPQTDVLSIGGTFLSCLGEFPTPEVLRTYAEQGIQNHHVEGRAYKTAARIGVQTIVIVSLDDTEHGLLLHASISHPDRYPTWEEIRALKKVVFGDTDCAMILPKEVNYVNVHERTFHLWEMPVEWGMR